VSIRWEEESNAWRADVGYRGKNGRRKTKYFREISSAAKGEALAEEAWDQWIRDRDRIENQGRAEAAAPIADLEGPAVAKPIRHPAASDEAARIFRAARKDVEVYTPECSRWEGCEKATIKRWCRRSNNTRPIRYRA
jgi:hypothetical protein